MELRNAVERIAIERQQMGLRVIDHLHAMLDGAEQNVGVRQSGSIFIGDTADSVKRLERVQRRWSSYGRIAPAVDHLLDLSEELDLANPPAPAFEVVPRSQPGSLREMV